MRLSRRSFVSAGLILASGVTAPRLTLADDAEVLLAKTAEDTQTAHVEIVLEAAGALKFKEKEAVKSLPTAVTARLVYDEKRLADEADGTRQTLRRYRSVEPTIRVDQTSFQPKLRTERNLVVARTAEAQPELHSPLGPMTSDESELLQLPFQTLLIDDLLPGKTVKVGESWKHDDAVLCSLLNLDAVSQSDVSSTLGEATAEAARVEFKGVVQGALGGVAAEFDVVGRYKFDRTQDRITWLAVLLKEKRAIGHVEPGVEATTRLQMTLAPIAEPKDLSVAELRDVDLSPYPELLRLEHVSQAGGYRLDHERRWHVMTDSNEVLALRLVDRGELLAQCNIRHITIPDPSRQPSLTQFQADIRRSLDKNFGQFVRVGESGNSLGQTIFRAEAAGTVEELTIHWIYYLVLDPSGRQVVFAFTVEQPLLDRFEGADTALVSTVRFNDPNATATQPTDANRR